MIRVQFFSRTWEELFDAEMPSVPRVGDTVRFSSTGHVYTVAGVDWQVGMRGASVAVRFAEAKIE